MLLKLDRKKKIYIVSRERGLSWYRRHLSGFADSLYAYGDGVHDDDFINEAIESLPKNPGGEIKLLEGEFSFAASANLVSSLTLKGCGRSTILTTSTANLIFLSAAGGPGTELTGVVIADLQIDGGVGEVSDCGIYFKYVDYSFIHNVYSRRHGTGTYKSGIFLLNSDFNILANNILLDNGFVSIGLLGIADNCYSNNLINNICRDNGMRGINLAITKSNLIIGNHCQGNDQDGIYIYYSFNTPIENNICQRNGRAGIYIDDSQDSIIANNFLTENSQETTNTYDDIYLESTSYYNQIQGNTCRAGALVNKPRYGINIADATCVDNLVTNNDLYDDGFGTGALNDAGTNTVTAAGNRT